MCERERVEERGKEAAERQGIGGESESWRCKETRRVVKEEELSREEIGEGYESLRLVNPLAEKQMQASLERYGQMSPVVVCRETSGGYELVDGFKRLHASRGICQLRTLRARVLEVGGRGAKAAVLCLNWVSRSVSDVEEGWVVRALCRDEGLTQAEVGELLGRDHSWVSRRLSLVERLSEEVQSQLRLGLITGTVGRELARVPRGTQERVLAAVLAHGLGSREVAGLVALLRESRPGEQERYLREPRQALAEQCKAHRAVSRDSRLGEVGNQLLQDLSRMERACTRVTSTVGIHGLSKLRGGEVLILAPALGQARRAGEQASAVLGQALRASEGKRDDDVQQP
jgi:ParB-like chromosome segregation protein Spo0J